MKVNWTLAVLTVLSCSWNNPFLETNPTLSGPDTSDYISPNIGRLVYVPAGRFQRDATATNISVISQPYRMSQDQITRAQWRTIFGDANDPSDTVRSTGLNDPVQTVNWYHAIAFCNKLSLAEGLTPVYSVTVGGTPVNWSALAYGSIPTASNADWNAATATWTNNGYRLPTEMEWMWAAMGAPADGQDGGTNTTGYAKAFAGSTGTNAIGDYAVYNVNSGPGGTNTETRRTRPAGSKLPNELGLYDMTGNVWEFVWDREGVAPNGEVVDYRGGASDARLLHGGSFASASSDCTLARVLLLLPHYTGQNRGIRIIRH